MALTLIINGNGRTFDPFPSSPSLLDLIAALELKHDRIALEHNGEIVSRTAWKDILLKENDRIEMVHFVGGGRT